MSVALAHPSPSHGFFHRLQNHRPLRQRSHKKRQRKSSPPRPSQSFSSSSCLLIPIPEENTVAFMSQPLTHAPHWDDETTRLIQQARQYVNLPPLQRCASLDEHARRQALAMGREERVFHSVTSVGALKQALRSDQVGENIHRGTSVQDMHYDIMQSSSINRANFTSNKFTQLGTATVLGEDGLLYSVQVFRQGSSTTCEEDEGKVPPRR
mmetsp:Transcript_10443/g.28879  ORF Transcript_10443/g.28879 Transcript_10443/m.28879 type:complete len:210 (-) Transcript_10443:1974-2603(-)